MKLTTLLVCTERWYSKAIVPELVIEEASAEPRSSWNLYLPLLFVFTQFELLVSLQARLEVAVLRQVQISGLVTVTLRECSSDIHLRYTGVVSLNEADQNTS